MSGFSEIIGNEDIIRHFNNAIRLDKVSHAYILNGEKGMGKNTIAKAFAKALQCEGTDNKPCGHCRSCNQVSSDNHPDIIMVTHDKPLSIGVEEIRTQINNTVEIKPYSGPYKVYLISEAEKMTPQAQNSLLKTIEEPPHYVVVILMTSNPEMLLPTIISRCIMLNLKPVSNEVVGKYIKDNAKLSEYELNIIIAFANGNLGKAIRLATSEHFLELKESVIYLLKHLTEMEVYEIVLSVKNLGAYKLEVNDYLDLMMTWFRDVLLYKITRSLDDLVYKDEYKHISTHAAKASYYGIETILQAMEKTKIRINANVNFDLAMELMFLTIKENIT